MFDSCQRAATGPKCADVSEKLVQLFGWRQTYNVAKLQRNIPGRATTKISLDKPQRKLKAQQSLPLKKSPDSWVVVHNLQTQGGGILDHDDRLNDVVDDREQILASFEDGDGSHHHGGGDGASGSSSVGTGSPDIFNDGNHKYVPSYPRTEIEVTGEQMALGASGALHVRRGSEPALNQLPIGPPPPSDNIKRWSAAPLIIEPTNTGYCNNSDWEDSRNEDDDQGYFRISRDGSKRLSMQFLGDGSGYRWAEAAERATSHSSTSLPRGSKRKEPLGQANNSTSPVPFTQIGNSSELIVIRNEPGPLGIHVVPDYDRLGKEKGLLVQGIEPGGRIDRDGRLAVNDHIIEINGQSVINMPFQRVQELFKLSLTSSELRLRVQKGNNSDGIHRPATFPRLPEDKENVSMVECEQKQNINTKVATVSPTKKVPAISRNLKSLITANTRKIGRKIELELTKGPHGLGFSITTRDNPAGGNCPIYIKNIIPKGAAVEDGRLKIGDRLLEVNGIEMTGKSQGEAVSILRNVPPGSKVRIVVSRQEDVPDNNLARTVVLETDERCEENNVPQVLNRSQDENANPAPAIPPLPQSHIQNQQMRQIDKNSSVAKIISQFQEANEKSEDGQIFPWKHREILTFDIPVHDSEKAGLGISVKGKTSGSQDLGIFIKSVINGGAASRDKRLRTNDQLLNVNGVSLLHQSNSDAMETLRKAMLHTEGPVPGSITLTIARRASSPGPNRNNSRRSSSAELLNSSIGSEIYRPNDSESSRNESSDPSGGSNNTVIYNPRKHSHTESSIIPNNQNFSPMQTWNPVLDRLTNHNKQLRNESYYIATHDTWSASMLAAGNQSLAKGPPQTVNLNSGDTILVEDDYGPRVIPHQNSRTPLSNCSLPQNKSDSQNNVDATDSKILQNCDKTTESSQTTANNDVTYASQLSLEQPNPATFSRDAFGRQSMSEKRHATLDAKNTDTYQRTKKMREERDKNKHRETNLVRVGSVESVISVNRSSEHPEQADKLGQLGPSLGMKKSSSLESLQTMVQEMQMQEEGDPAYCYRNNAGLKVVRGRGCEESFRAAVIDPNHRSETTAKKHWLLDPPAQERQIDGFSNVRGGPRQSSLNANLDGKHKGGKKKPGIFKGIGSMFRFGKHRKMDFNPPEQYKPQGEGILEKSSTPHSSPQQKQPQPEQNHSSQPEIKNEKSVDQRNNNCNERLTEQPPEPLYHRHGFVQGYAEQVQVIPEGTALTTTNRPNINHGQYDQNHNRGERSQLMRAYEQRQAQRQHYYHQNTENSKTDQAGRQRLDPAPYGEYGKPGSRYGISEPIRFTHYVNYDELQNHISRKQQQYHSQRQIRQNNQLRPVSNFYEYESVQSILNVHGRADRPVAPPVTHVHQHSDSYQETTANSLTRHPGVPLRTVANSRSNHPNHFTQNRGPFITQVLIGDHAQHTGSRV